MDNTVTKKRSRVVSKMSVANDAGGAPVDEELMLRYRVKMAENLPTLRARLKMTQGELAKILDVSRHTIIGIENHSRTMMWTTYLSMIYVFRTCRATAPLLDVLGLMPVELISSLESRMVE